MEGEKNNPIEWFLLPLPQRRHTCRMLLTQ
jgi:hypothetical protein